MSWQEGWPEGAGRRWLDALSIPARDWARPLVGELGLPDAIARRPEALAGIAEDAARRREELQRETQPAHGAGGLDSAMTREVVIHAVHQLADAYSSDDARAFERWARLHVVEPDPGVWAWQLVFTHWLAQGDGADAPAAVRRERDFIDGCVGPEASERLAARVREVAPEPTAEDREVGSEVPREAGIAQEVIERERTLKSLRRLREQADAGAIDEIARWAREAAEALRLPGEIADPGRLADVISGGPESQPFESALDLPLPERPSG